MSLDKRKTHTRNYAIPMLVAGIVLVLAIFCTYAFTQLGRSVEKWGSFGDKFGALNALFAGLAFVGLISTLASQQKEIADARQDFSDLKESLDKMTGAMANQASQMENQNDLLKLQNDHMMKGQNLHALIARIEAYGQQIDRNEPGTRKALYAEQHELLRRLDKVLKESV